MSVIRYYQNKWYKNVPLLGDVLDLGNKNPNAEYLKYQNGDVKSITFSDLNSRGRQDVIVQDFNLPFNESYYGKFDTILCYNVLEHVYDFEQLAESIFNLLKPSGKAYVTVPFLHKVHGDPSDFHRFTKYALAKHFEKLGFQVILRETGFGPFHLISHAVVSTFGEWLLYPSLLLAKCLDDLLGTFVNIKPWALGYSMELKK